MLGKIMGPIRRQGVDELLGAIPEISWSWIQEMDSQLRAQGALENMIDEWRAGVKAEVEQKTWWGVEDWEELEG